MKKQKTKFLQKTFLLIIILIITFYIGTKFQKPEIKNNSQDINKNNLPVKNQNSEIIEKNYEWVKEINSNEIKNSDNKELMPVFKKTFGNVKLIEELNDSNPKNILASTSILIYTTNKIITENNINTIQNELEKLGYTTESKSAIQLILTKSTAGYTKTLALHFTTNDEGLALIRILSI